MKKVLIAVLLLGLILTGSSILNNNSKSAVDVAPHISDPGGGGAGGGL